MPVVNLPVHLLKECLGHPIEAEALVEHLQHLGCDVEGYEDLGRFKCGTCGAIHEVTAREEAPGKCEECGTDFQEHPDLVEHLDSIEVIRMELLPVRPDIFDPGGLARALRTYLEVDLAPPAYTVTPGDYTVTVDPAMADPESHRPFIACCVVRGLHLDDTRIKVVMKLQENLHWALGRDRKFASIGVYDLSRVRGTALRYRPVDPDEMTFVPLGCDPGGPGMTPRQVLAAHPKGQAFSHLLTGHRRYPLLEDAEGGVLSMPPIINSEPTRVRMDTTDFFIDVTGLNDRLVQKALNILTTSFAEMSPGVELESVEIRYADRTVTTPDLTREEHVLDPAAAARLIGVDLSPEAVETLLRRMGHEVEPGQKGTLRVQAPAYRNDLLHEVDLVEDVAIAYGFHNVPPRLVPSLTVGGALAVEDASAAVSRLLTGLGFLETLSLPVTSPELCFDALRRQRTEAPALEIENPIHDDSGVALAMLRTDLLPGLLQCLARYRGAELPQKLFEVGDVTHLDADAETGAREIRRTAAVSIHNRAGFAEARSLAGALIREMGWQLEAVAGEEPFYLPGRCARILAVKGDRKHDVGHFGEVHPEVLEHFGLTYPVAAVEVDVGRLGKEAGDEAEPGGFKLPASNRTFL